LLEVGWKITKRLVFLVVAAFVCLNAVAWVVLNSPPVQRAVVAWVNAEVLSARGLELALGSLSLSFLTSEIAVNDVRVRVADAAQRVDPETGELQDLELGAAEFRVRVDPLTSWIRKELTIVSASVDGLFLDVAYDAQGRLVLPFESSTSPERKVEEILREVREILPSEVTFTDATIALGDAGGSRYQRVDVDRLVVINRKRDADIVPFDVELALGGAVARAPELPQEITLDSLAAFARVTNRLAVSIDSFKATTSLGDAQASGSVIIPVDGAPLGYRLAIEADTAFGPVMALLGLDGVGSVRVEGALYKDPKDAIVPAFEGVVSWSAARLEGFALYDGAAKVALRSRAIDYRDAVIRTPRGGLIRGEGRFELYDRFLFANNARVEKFRFRELLAGFGVETDAFDFDLGSEDLSLDGHIRGKNGDLAFELDAYGQATAAGLGVPALDGPKRARLPDCRLQVKLRTDDSRLDLRGTTISCAADGADQARVDEGSVRYSDGRTDFRFDWLGADLAHATYFTGFPTEGRADIKGTVTASNGQPVVFRSRTTARDVLLYGVRYATVEGVWGVDEKGVFGEDLVGAIAAKSEEGDGARVELDAFRVDFDAQTTSSFRGRIEGDLGAGFAATSALLPASFPRMEGALASTEVRLEGPLLKPTRWTLAVDGGAQNLSLLGFRAARASVAVACQKGTCRNGRLFADGIAEFDPVMGVAVAGGSQSSLPKSKPAGGSYFLADVRELSEDFVNVRAVVRSVPFRVEFGERFPLRGVLDARVDLAGPWKAWEGSLQVAADALRLGEQDLGSVSITGFSADGKDINVVGHARYQQLSLRLRMPHSLQGPSTLYLRTRGLDVGFLLPQSTIAKHNLYTQIDGEVLLQGPAPLTRGSDSDAPWYRQWQAQGALSRASFQYRQLRFALDAKTDFTLLDARLEVPRMRLTAPSGHVELAGSYDFESAEVDARLGARVRLGVLEDLFGKVGTSEGELVADVRMEGVAPEVSLTGEAGVEGGTVAFRDYPPPFTDIRGSFLFDDDKLEVRSLRARKGEGEVEVAGSVNWAAWLEDASRTPVVAMRIVARDAQVRIPVPFVEAFDTTLDGTLELSGDELPYTLSGDIRVKRAATFRDKTCQDLLAEANTQSAEELRLGSRAAVRLNLQVLSEKGIIIQTACVTTRLSANVKVTGTSEAPVLAGVVDSEGSGQVSFLKSNFSIQRAEFVFDNPVRLDPRLDIQLLSRIDVYNVYVQVDGTLSRRRTNLWVDPPSTPEGVTLTRSDIFRMLSTGQPPNRAGTQGQALVSQVAGYVYGATSLDDSLTQAAQRITGGFVDSVQLQPIIENGQTKWKARVSRSLGERLSLGLDIEQGQAVNNQSLNGTVFINDSVNVLGGFDRRSEQTEQYYELSGGLRFQFGSSR
jgi:hypothetical protein